MIVELFRCFHSDYPTSTVHYLHKEVCNSIGTRCDIESNDTKRHKLHAVVKSNINNYSYFEEFKYLCIYFIVCF